MPNAPDPAAAKRTPPTDRQNAQGDHEGSPHRPEEFQKADPATARRDQTTPTEPRIKE